MACTYGFLGDTKAAEQLLGTIVVLLGRQITLPDRACGQRADSVTGPVAMLTRSSYLGKLMAASVNTC
jgi:hypothetical protein